MAVLREIWANYRDESFISQFLSPRLMRQMRMFHVHDDPAESDGIRVEAIHDERGYRRIRRAAVAPVRCRLDRSRTSRSSTSTSPATAACCCATRSLNGGLLDEADARHVLQHLADLWSYDVMLREVDASDTVLKEHAASPRATAIAA